MANNSLDFLGDALAAPLGNLIAAIGEGIGEAQAAMDRGSLEQMLALYREDPENRDEVLEMLRQVGYQPTFYAIPEAKVKAKVSLALSQSTSSQGTSPAFPDRLSRTKVYGAPVNAGMTNKFNVNLNASAEIEFTIKPVPPLVEARVVPDLEGKTLDEAMDTLSKLGLDYTIAEGEDPAGSDKVKKQIPEKNTPVRSGSVVELSFDI